MSPNPGYMRAEDEQRACGSGYRRRSCSRYITYRPMTVRHGLEQSHAATRSWMNEEVNLHLDDRRPPWSPPDQATFCSSLPTCMTSSQPLEGWQRSQTLLSKRRRASAVELGEWVAGHCREGYCTRQFELALVAAGRDVCLAHASRSLGLIVHERRRIWFEALRLGVRPQVPCSSVSTGPSGGD
ncbi:hypothetical protein BJ546DRAFT_668189 [Cryomyces antarcticus]